MYLKQVSLFHCKLLHGLNRRLGLPCCAPRHASRILQERNAVLTVIVATHTHTHTHYVKLKSQ